MRKIVQTFAAAMMLGVAAFAGSTAGAETTTKQHVPSGAHDAAAVMQTETGGDQTAMLGHRIAADDQTAIRLAVKSHVWALSNGVSGMLPGQVAPTIGRSFADAEALMAFLAKTHKPVAEAASFRLGELKMVGTTPVQVGFIQDRNHRTWKIAYAMMRDNNGAWRIASCFFVPVPGQNV
ncbi:MAG: DUF4864 domain-containing protein [Pseudomonadota bacterium]